jgi:hypothetical protein
MRFKIIRLIRRNTDLHYMITFNYLRCTMQHHLVCWKRAKVMIEKRISLNQFIANEHCLLIINII